METLRGAASAQFMKPKVYYVKSSLNEVDPGFYFETNMQKHC